MMNKSWNNNNAQKMCKIILKSSLRKKFYKFKLIKITLGNGYNIISKNYNNLNIKIYYNG